MLQNKSFDAFLGDTDNLIKMAEADPKLRVLKEPLQKESLAIAVNKGNDKLLTEINKALIKLKKSGKIKTLIKKYMKAEQ